MRGVIKRFNRRLMEMPIEPEAKGVRPIMRQKSITNTAHMNRAINIILNI
jgi:hypothetical protein